MTIANGNPQLSVDVNAVFAGAMAAARARAGEKPAVYWACFDYRNLVAGTLLAARTSTIVLPDDAFLEELCLETCDQFGDVAATVTSDATLLAAISVGATTGSGYGKAARYYATPGRPEHLLLRGSTITLVVSTTDAAGTQNLTVMLGLAAARRRA